MSNDDTIERVSRLVEPILRDVHLELYDLEFRGGVLRVTIDTPPGTDRGVDIDQLSLVTKLLSRDLDHHDPVPGHYTLEVSSPGLERQLRTAAHFRREVGKTVAVRLREAAGTERRVHGVLVSATEHDFTVRLDDAELSERVIPIDLVDRARTVFVWAAQPKPGSVPAKPGASRADGAARSAPTRTGVKRSGGTAPAASGTTGAGRRAAARAAVAARSRAATGRTVPAGPSDELDPPSTPPSHDSHDQHRQEAS
jgi:ribosome maturation factor RimP